MDDFTEQPTFNMAIATLERINNLLVQISTEQIRRRTILIQRLLYELYKEIYPFMNDEERTTTLTKWLKLRESGVFQDPNGKTTFRPELLNQLDQFDFYLRDLLNKHDLLMPKSKDPSDAFLE